MGCSSCQGHYQTAPTQVAYNRLSDIVGDCPYTVEQLESWKQLFLCAKRNGILDVAITNRALGIIASATNHSYNICYFQSYLQEFEPMVLALVNDNQCQ